MCYPYDIKLKRRLHAARPSSLNATERVPVFDEVRSACLSEGDIGVLNYRYQIDAVTSLVGLFGAFRLYVFEKRCRNVDKGWVCISDSD